MKIKKDSIMTKTMFRTRIEQETEKKLKEYMDNCTAYAHMMNLLVPALATWAGKDVTKRLITRLRLYIPEEYYLYLKKGWNGMELVISRGNKSITLALTPTTKDKILRMQFVRDKNKYYFTAKEEYDKYSKGKENLDKWIDRYLEICSKIRDLKKDMGECGCEYLLDFDLRYTGIPTEEEGE